MRSIPTLRFFASVAFAFLFSSAAIHAASYKWDADSNASTGTPPTATPGSGTWNTTLTNWTLSNVNAAWTNANDAQFGGGGGASGNYAITVDPTVTSAGAITFVTSGFTLSSTAAQTLTATSLSLSSGVTATIGNNLTISGATLGTTTGGGTLILNGGTASTGTSTNLTIHAGVDFTVKVETAGLLSAGSSILVGSSGSTGTATLQVDGGNVTTAGSNATLILGNAVGTSVVTLNTGTINLSGSTSGSSRVRFGPGTLSSGTVTGTFNLNGGTLTAAAVIEGTQSGTGSVLSTFNFNGGTLTTKTGTDAGATFMTGLDTANVRNGGAVFDTNGVATTVGQALLHSTVGGDNATDGGLTKNGSGTLTLSGASTYTGATKVNTGTLTLGSAGTIDNSSGVNVASGAIFNTAAKTSGYAVNGLAGAGTVTGLLNQAVTLNTGGILAPGDSGVGTLTFNAGNLAMANGTTFSCQIGGTTLSPVNDLVLLTGTGSTVSFTGTQTLLLANIGTVNPTGLTFVLFDSVASLSIAGTWTINYGSTGWTGGTVGIASGNVVLSGLTLASVPEPSTCAPLMGLAGLAGVLSRRRLRR